MNTESPTTPAASRHLLILASGSFGSEVADRLKDLYPTTVQAVDHGTHPSLWPHADLIVLATAMESPRIAEAVDGAAFIRRIPWFQVLARPTGVQCGPVVIPGRTACYQCFVRRKRQHGIRDVPLDSGDRPQPTGYARHHVGIAVGFARQAIREAFDGPDDDSLGGSVRLFNHVSGLTTKAPVVAVDGCQRCRGRFGSTEESRNEFWRKLESVGTQTPLSLGTALQNTAVSE